MRHCDLWSNIFKPHLWPYIVAFSSGIMLCACRVASASFKLAVDCKIFASDLEANDLVSLLQPDTPTRVPSDMMSKTVCVLLILAVAAFSAEASEYLLPALRGVCAAVSGATH